MEARTYNQIMEQNSQPETIKVAKYQVKKVYYVNCVCVLLNAFFENCMKITVVYENIFIYNETKQGDFLWKI